MEYINSIADALERNGKPIQHFRCHDLFENRQSAQLAARALKRHLNKSGGRLGGFTVKMTDATRRKHGILWKATKLTPKFTSILKNGK